MRNDKFFNLRFVVSLYNCYNGVPERKTDESELTTNILMNTLNDLESNINFEISNNSTLIRYD